MSLPEGTQSDDDDFISDSDEAADLADDDDYEIESVTEEENLEEDSSADDLDDGPESDPLPKRKKKDPQNKPRIEWKTSKNSKWEMPSNYAANNEPLRLAPGVHLTRFSSPMRFFELFANDELIDFIYEQTQLYNAWRGLNSSTRLVKNITKEEIKTGIGIVLQMGIVKLPNHRMHWAPDTRNELIAESMT